VSKLKFVAVILAVILATVAATSVHDSASKKFYWVQGPVINVQPGGEYSEYAFCHKGDLATGGGFQFNGDQYASVEDSEPNGPYDAPVGWNVTAFNNDPANAHIFFVMVMCEHNQ